MSSLLQRMVQGTLAPQSRIEPVLPARYAVPGSGSAGSQADQGDGMEAFREENQFSLAEPQSARSLGPFEFSSTLNRRDLREKQGVNVEQDSTFEPAVVGRPSSSDRSAQRSRSAEVSIATQAERQDPGLNKTEAASPAMPAQLPKTTSTRAALSPANMSGTLQRSSLAPERASIGSLRDSKKTGAEQEAVQRRAMGEPLALRRPEDQPAMRRSERVPFTAPAGAETTTTHVTISIGHVEIRAEQPMARPRRPAFRPRVSLSDFLNQRKPERV